MNIKEEIYAILKTYNIDETEVKIEDEVADIILIALRQPGIEFVKIDEEGGLLIDYGPEEQ